MKSILLHIHDDLGRESRMQAAFDLARATGAHIHCVQVTPVAEFVSADVFGGGYMLPDDIAFVREEEEKERRLVETRMAREGVTWDWEHLDGDVVSSLLAAGRLSDAIVVTLPESGRRHDNDPLPIVADLAVGGRAPVLAVPPSVGAVDFCGRAVVAWDGSQESAMALRAALPLLAHAGQVHLVTVEESGKHGFPSTGASAFLARHGVASELHEWPQKDRSIGEALLAATRELAADYMVMGAFGHNRLREFIFGGVTAELLRGARIPLLLAH